MTLDSCFFEADCLLRRGYEGQRKFALHGPATLLNSDGAVHFAEVAGESAHVGVVACFGGGEFHYVGFAGAELGGVGDDGGFAFGIGGDVVVVFGLDALGGHHRHQGAGFENDEVVRHASFGDFADVFDGDFHRYTHLAFDFARAETHLVVGGDFHFDGRCRCDEWSNEREG